MLGYSYRNTVTGHRSAKLASV